MSKFFDNHPEFFKLYNDVYFKTPNRKIINNLLYWNKKIPTHKSDCLEVIRLQMQDVYDALLPLLNVGLPFSMNLTGGAVRDFLSDKEDLISDLDIHINTAYKTHSIFSPPTIERFLKDTGFSLNNEIENYLTRENQSLFSHWGKTKKKKAPLNLINSIQFDFLLIALSQKFEIIEVFIPTFDYKKIENCESYIDLRIQGVIKIKHHSWSYPVDVLISNYYLEDFLNAFDFDFCKVGFEFVREFNLSRAIINTPQKPEDMLKNCFLTKQFLSDYNKKELTSYISSNTYPIQIKSSLEKHLPKILKKYPDYKLSIIKDGYISNESYEYLTSLQQKIDLSTIFPPKETNKKIKI